MINHIQITQIKGIIANASLDDLRIIREYLSNRQDQLGYENKFTLQVGQVVWVNHPKLKGVSCVIKEIKRTKASIKCDRGAYTVPLSLIEAVR